MLSSLRRKKPQPSKLDRGWHLLIQESVEGTLSLPACRQADDRSLLKRLLSHRLRVVEAAPQSNRSRNNDGASQKDTHGSVPRFGNVFKARL